VVFGGAAGACFVCSEAFGIVLVGVGVATVNGEAGQLFPVVVGEFARDEVCFIEGDPGGLNTVASGVVLVVENKKNGKPVPALSSRTAPRLASGKISPGEIRVHAQFALARPSWTGLRFSCLASPGLFR